jgi:hypothetical protein
VLLAFTLVWAWQAPDAFGADSRGSNYWPLFGTSATWLTWNSTGGWVYIPEAGINLAPRTVLLEAKKGDPTGPGYCVDAVFDWAVSVSPNVQTHYDARLRRDCNQGLRTWSKAESAAPAGDLYVLVGQQKTGACYLLNATSNGRFGSNLLTNNWRQVGNCVGYAAIGDATTELSQIQAGFPTSPANPVCVSARIAYGTINLALDSLNDRSCTS